MAKPRTLREFYILESDLLFEPKAKDQKTSWNWHKESRTNSVNDLQRATKFGVGGRTSNTVAYDRANNDESVYRGSTKVYDRVKNRHGYALDGSDARAFDFGRAYGVSDQGPAGLKGTILPVVTVAESLGLDMEDIDDLPEEELGGLVLLTETLQRRHF